MSTMLSMSKFEECGRMYGFNVEEALVRLGLLERDGLLSREDSLKKAKSKSKKSKVEEKVESKVESKVEEKVDSKVEEKVEEKQEIVVMLPFSTASEDHCQAIKWSDGLYLQCERSKVKGCYCSSHQKEADKNESGKPSHGTVEDRLAQDLLNYCYPNKPKQTPYAKIMRKLGYTKEDVEAAAAEKSVVIDPRHFEGYDAEEEPKAKKAPKEKKAKEPKEPKEPKEKKAKEPKEKKAKEPKEPKESKPKGRPAKAKKVAEPSNDDMFDALIADLSDDAEESSDEVEPEVVNPITFEGKVYLRSRDSGIIYDENDWVNKQEQTIVGKWNKETEKIDFKEDSDNEEEEEEYDE
jgi:hypothetical protein